MPRFHLLRLQLCGNKTRKALHAESFESWSRVRNLGSNGFLVLLDCHRTQQSRKKRVKQLLWICPAQSEQEAAWGGAPALSGESALILSSQRLPSIYSRGGPLMPAVYGWHKSFIKRHASLLLPSLLFPSGCSSLLLMYLLDLHIILPLRLGQFNQLSGESCVGYFI